MSEERIQAKEIGASGEFVLHYLLEHGSSLVGATESLFDPRLFEGAPQRTLHDQSVAWLREVSPGTSLEIDAVRGIDLAFARFSFERQGDVPTRGFRPSNVGFGLSYTLPVIVALLAANPGDIVIIENPEAHLHPRGQTRLGQLAARTASAGIQVIAETHSDHFMDGVRIEVRESRIDPGEVAFHYFQRRDGRAAVASPVIDDDGRLSEWPTGFFDQHDENLARLIASEE